MAEDEIRDIFFKNLRRIMDLNSKTQADLARYMKVSTASAAFWYTGQRVPRVDKIQAIARWLGVDSSDLLEDKDEEPDYYLDNADSIIGTSFVGNS